ncbi:MAG: radical SAM protein [Candidatus Pacearchaeota archaeon]|nr:radical SAM protein [Candidatus Pacearchaeota archaeon]
MKNILFLNPPSRKKLQRDFICSSSSKADYYWAPIDFVVLSGILKDYNLSFIDSIIQNIPPKETCNKIKKLNPDYIISLVSSVDFDNEIKLFQKIKESNPKLKFIVTGDIAFFESKRVIREKSIDAILLDFTSREIIKYIENPNNKKINNMYNKINNKIIFNNLVKEKTFSYGKANLELFNLKKYSVPYSIYTPLAPILTNYGCPYKCSFCSSGRIGYKLREIEEVKKEIISFKQKGFKEIFIRDFNFTTNKSFVKEFCKFMINHKIKLCWSCEARVDNVDESLLTLMKKAGCYLIFFGVEAGSQNKIDKFQKNIPMQNTRDIFKICRKLKIKTLASFVLGLPEDTKQDMLNTINFAKMLKPDYVSFNLYVPRYGSVLREQLLKEKKITYDDKFDSSSEFNNFTELSDKEIKQLFNYANKTFYFNIKYILKKLTEIRSYNHFKNHFVNGIKLIKNSL